jgi:hypothetical protein
MTFNILINLNFKTITMKTFKNDKSNTVQNRLSDITNQIERILNDLNYLKLELAEQQKEPIIQFNQRIELSELLSKVDCLDNMERRYDMDLNLDYGSSVYNTFFKVFGNKYSRKDILAVLLFILNIASDYRGYAFGGIVRDFLVPRLYATNNDTKLDFKDVDLSFGSSDDANNFINYLSNPNSSLVLRKAETVGYTKIDEHRIYKNVFERYQYVVVFNGQDLFILDIIVSEYFPVNDMSVNLLMFTPKSDDYSKIDETWFDVGRNNIDSYNYSVKSLIISCCAKISTLLSEFKSNKDTNSMNGHRISNFHKRGYKFSNFKYDHY